MKLKFRYFKDNSKLNGNLKSTMGIKVNRKSNYVPTPRITVAELYDDDGNLRSTGYALCSLKENPIKKIGKQIAAGRAWKAYTNQSSCGPVLRHEAKAVVMDCLDDIYRHEDSVKLFYRQSTPLKCVYYD